MKNKNLAGILSILLCEILFGFSYLFTKNITNSISPINLLGWRFAVAFIVMNICVAAGLVKINFKGKPVLKLIGIAIFHPVLYFVGEAYGITMTTASESAVIIASLPLVTIALSALIMKKLPARIQVLGVATTISGVIIITLAKGMEFLINPYGYLALFLGIVSYSIYAVCAEMSREFSNSEKTYVMILMGFIVFSSIALLYNAGRGQVMEFIKLPFSKPEFLAAILYLGAGCSVLAFLVNNIAISTIGTNRSASFVGVSTVVSVLSSVLILKEKFSPLQALGAVLVLSGVYIANSKIKIK